ncbi:MAG: hypothetical protein ACTSQZ_01135 [Candidatus Thorarchaeota archaeon]
MSTIYDRKKKKERGISCGTFVPIIFCGWLYFETGSWVFLVAIGFFLVSLFQRIISNIQGRSKVQREIAQDRHMTLGEISSSVGMPEERIRRHIVDEKRSGTSDIWFDSKTGETTSKPVGGIDSSIPSKVGCAFCGFALRDDDRFCPYCSAPIRV